VSIDTYKCWGCGRMGVKLWRDSYPISAPIRLRCAACAAKREGVSLSDIAADGFRQTRHGRTDNIGLMVPAIPTTAPGLFWGYGAAPPEAVSWWNGLPVEAS
jgi:hypothetical protein